MTMLLRRVGKRGERATRTGVGRAVFFFVVSSGVEDWRVAAESSPPSVLAFTLGSCYAL